MLLFTINIAATLPEFECFLFCLLVRCAHIQSLPPKLTILQIPNTDFFVRVSLFHQKFFKKISTPKQLPPQRACDQHVHSVPLPPLPSWRRWRRLGQKDKHNVTFKHFKSLLSRSEHKQFVLSHNSPHIHTQENRSTQRASFGFFRWSFSTTRSRVAHHFHPRSYYCRIEGKTTTTTSSKPLSNWLREYWPSQPDESFKQATPHKRSYPSDT